LDTSAAEESELFEDDIGPRKHIVDPFAGSRCTRFSGGLNQQSRSSIQISSGSSVGKKRHACDTESGVEGEGDNLSNTHPKPQIKRAKRTSEVRESVAPDVQMADTTSGEGGASTSSRATGMIDIEITPMGDDAGSDRVADINSTGKNEDKTTSDISMNPAPLEMNLEEANNAGISANGTGIEVNGMDIEENGAEIEANGASIEANGTGIKANGASIEVNDMGIKANGVGIGEANSAGISNSEEGVDSMDSMGIAADVDVAYGTRSAPLNINQTTIKEVIAKIQADNGKDRERAFIVTTIEALQSASAEEDWVLALKAWALFERHLGYPPCSVGLSL